MMPSLGDSFYFFLFNRLIFFVAFPSSAFPKIDCVFDGLFRKASVYDKREIYPCGYKLTVMTPF